LSKLVGRQKSVYEYLANAQGTQYAVTPVHTDDEFNHLHSLVGVGGKYAPSSGGLPHFDQMAAEWSLKANVTTIFYKLCEHLANYYSLAANKKSNTVISCKLFCKTEK
jgi:hypothetical protein